MRLKDKSKFEIVKKLLRIGKIYTYFLKFTKSIAYQTTLVLPTLEKFHSEHPVWCSSPGPLFTVHMGLTTVSTSLRHASSTWVARD